MDGPVVGWVWVWSVWFGWWPLFLVVSIISRLSLPSRSIFLCFFLSLFFSFLSLYLSLSSEHRDGVWKGGVLFVCGDGLGGWVDGIIIIAATPFSFSLFSCLLFFLTETRCYHRVSCRHEGAWRCLGLIVCIILHAHIHTLRTYLPTLFTLPIRTRSGYVSGLGVLRLVGWP